MIRVLIVDDSAVVRSALARELAAEPDIQIVGEAADAYEARECIVNVNPDVITLDVQMPRMDGITFLARLMKYHPLPVVIYSAVTEPNSEAALHALSLGAVEVVAKPGPGSTAAASTRQLVRAIRAAARANLKHELDAGADTRPETPHVGLNPALRALVKQRPIAIGASTGGPAALVQLFRALPATFPLPILLVIHIGAPFGETFSTWLDQQSGLRSHVQS